MDKRCLNCGKTVTNRYCSQCGQKSDIHRISLKHFLSHDLLHGTFHIERGMLFTAKQALIRPGKAALDYIAGKRVIYYNFFYFILLLIGLNFVLTHYYNELALKYAPERAMILKMNEGGKALGYLLSKYVKIFIFSLVPLTALNSYILFKRKRLNFSEHIIVSGTFLLGVILLFSVVLLFSFLEFIGLPGGITDAIRHVAPYLILLYIIYGYFNAFRKDYSLLGFSYRMLLFFLFASVEILLLLVIIVWIAAGGDADALIELSL